MIHSMPNRSDKTTTDRLHGAGTCRHVRKEAHCASVGVTSDEDEIQWAATGHER
jgi:hypothetical protein